MNSGTEMTLYNVRLPLNDEQAMFEITIKDDQYEKVEKQQPAVSPSAVSFSNVRGEMAGLQEVDLEGRLLLPSFVDIHTHLDKAFSLQAVPNQSGTLPEAIRNYSKQAHLFTKTEIKQRVIRAAIQSLSYGTTHIRTHVNFELDVSASLALEHLEAVLEAKQELSPYLTLQVVPMFSQIYGRPRKELDIVETAIHSGVDGIGGAPHIFPQAAENIEALVKLAIKYDKVVDLHVDENDDPSVSTIETLIRLTEQHGLQGKVTAGHLCSLAGMEDAKAERIIEKMAKTKVNAVTLPGANMYLQGRGDRGIVRRGITRVKELLQAGVSIATASDNVNDPFHPFGRGDMAQIGLLTAYTAHLASKEEIKEVVRMATAVPAAIFGLPDHMVKKGAPANFVIFDTNDIYDLFASLSPTRLVFTNGEWLSDRHTQVTFQDPKLSSLWKTATQTEMSEV